MHIHDRILFLKYALPCAGTLVKRGNVTQAHIDKLISLVAKGIEPEQGAERILVVANAVCADLAEKMGKDSIESAVIRQYFLRNHSEVVEDRYKLMRDFDPIACNTYAGTVMALAEGKAMIKTRLGSNAYRTDFTPDIGIGNAVIVHWDFVVERLPEGFADMLTH
jgi:hypothetical protein